MPYPFSAPLDISAEQRQQLEALLRASSTPQALAFRCRIVLRCGHASNPSNLQVANELGCNRHTVGLWRERFREHGLPGLQDAPRSGRPRSFSPGGACGGRKHCHQLHRGT
jgi:transposase-like protein